MEASYGLGVGSAKVLLASCPRLLHSAKSGLLFITIDVGTDECIVTALCSSRSDKESASSIKRQLAMTVNLALTTARVHLQRLLGANVFVSRGSPPTFVLSRQALV